MKTSKFYSFILATCTLLLLTACFHDDDDDNVIVKKSPFAFPVAADANEAGGGNDTFATATTAALGSTQINTNFPQDDRDYFAVVLTAGTDYEFSANRLCATCDTEMNLFDTDGTSLLFNNDDWVGYDSAIQYTPTISGTYYVEVKGLDDPYAITTYTFGARLLVDDDGDGWSTYHDCDDTDPAVFPDQTEVPGDGIDQSCTGFDVPVGTVADQHESDDTPATAVTMVKAEGTPWEEIYRSELFSPAGNLRTIDAVGAVDYMKISVPAMSAIEVDIEYDDIPTGVLVSAFDPDGTTPVSGANTVDNIYNTTAGALTYFYRYEATNGTDTGAYVPYYYSLGQDMDGDGFYTQDWGSDRDCDDTDAAINDGAVEVVADGIDSNCDGSDDT